MAPEGWDEVELGELIDVKHGFAFKGQYFHDEPPGDILLTPGNFAIGGGFKHNKLKYYTGPVPEEFVLTPGDLLVTMTDLSKGADTLGYPARVPAQQGEARYLHNQRLGLVTVKDSERADKRFLYYLMCSLPYRQEVVAGATGTTVKHTSPTKIRQFRAAMPPRPEQEIIANTLGALDDKIQLNRRMNRTLEAMAQTTYRSWFIDFEPVRAKAAGATSFRGMPQDVFDGLTGEFTETQLGIVPAGWRHVPIGDLVRVVGGSTPRTTNPEFWEGGEHAFCTPKDLSRLTSPVLLDTERHITNAGVGRISSGQLPIGTVVLSSRAPIGYLALAETPISVNQGIIAMVTGEVPNTYVLLWVDASIEAVKSRAGGTTFAEISKGSFRAIPALRPDTSTLEAFGDYARLVFQLIASNERESRLLAVIRDALLPKMISGEIRVSGAEGVDDDR